jgi:hypothetical protein
LSRRQLMKEKGLHLCDARDPVTKRFCRKIFVTAKGLKKHEALGGNHDFPVGVNARTQLLLALSKPGGFLAAGSRPNWMNKAPIVATIESTEECEDAKCFGAFNRKEDGLRRKFTQKQRDILEKLYWIEPKLNAKQMRAQMAEMFDDDGTLLFTYAKEITTGILLTEEQINSWVTRRTAARKKTERAANNGRQDPVEMEQQQLIDDILAENEGDGDEGGNNN